MTVDYSYRNYYSSEPLVSVTKDIPEVSSAANQHHLTVGGFISDPKTGRLVITTTLDNLLKGAATQCLQNINIMQRYPEYTAIPISPKEQANTT